MNNLRKTYQRWPKWIRLLFSTFGFLFISLIIIIIARIISGFKVIDTSGLGVVLLADVLVLLLTVQAISPILKRGINSKAIVISALLGLIGIFLVFIFEGLRLLIFENYILKGEVSVLNSYITELKEIIREIDPSFTIPPLNYPIAGFFSSENIILLITAVSGLITAITGLYGQIISSRKIKAELELAKQQLALEQKKIELEASRQDKDLSTRRQAGPK